MGEGGEGLVAKIKEFPKKTATLLAKKYPSQIFKAQSLLRENPHVPVILPAISLVWSGANLINHFTPEGLAVFVTSSFGLKEGFKLTKQLLAQNKASADILKQLNDPKSELGIRIREAMKESKINE